MVLLCQTKYSLNPLACLQKRLTTDTERKTEEQSKRRVLLSCIFSFIQWSAGQASPQSARMLFSFQKINRVLLKSIVCETSVGRESLLEWNFTWGKNLKVGANNFERTCAVQAMIPKVLRATDFFHGLPFETKRQLQAELGLMKL